MHSIHTQSGKLSNRTAAYELTRHIGSWQMPRDVNDDEWQVELERLTDLVCPPTEGPKGSLIVILDEPDVNGVWQWFWNHYPKCMKLVPARRKNVFVEGVRAVFDDENVEF